MILNHFLVSKFFAEKQFLKEWRCSEVNQVFFEADSTHSWKYFLSKGNLRGEGKMFLGSHEKLLNDQHLQFLLLRKLGISSMFSFSVKRFWLIRFRPSGTHQAGVLKSNERPGTNPGEIFLVNLKLL